MAKYKNDEHFNISGSKKVRVVVEFDADEKTSDVLAMKNAMDYINFFLNTQPRQHKAWGYSIEVQN